MDLNFLNPFQVSWNNFKVETCLHITQFLVIFGGSKELAVNKRHFGTMELYYKRVKTKFNSCSSKNLKIRHDKSPTFLITLNLPKRNFADSSPYWLLNITKKSSYISD